MILGIASNGPLTSFRWQFSANESVNLCRLDIERFAKGELEFHDQRTFPSVDQTMRERVVKEAQSYLLNLQEGRYFADLDGFTRHFFKNRKRYEPLSLSDIGAYFQDEHDMPYVLLGARAGVRGCPIVLDDLLNDQLVWDSVAHVSQLLTQWRLDGNECTVRSAKPYFRNTEGAAL